MGIGPVADLLMHLQIFFIARGLISIQSGNNGLCLRPPELHILRIILGRKILAITEINDTAIFFVPSPVPGPVKDSQCHIHQFFIPIAVLGLFQNKPGRLDAVSRIDGATVDRIDKFSVRTYHFKQCLEFRMHEISTQCLDGTVYLLCQQRVVDSRTDA